MQEVQCGVVVLNTPQKKIKNGGVRKNRGRTKEFYREQMWYSIVLMNPYVLMGKQCIPDCGPSFPSSTVGSDTIP